MSLRSSVVCALTLFVVVPVLGGSPAEAGNGTKTVCKYGQCWVFAGVLSSTPSRVTAEVESDAASEELILVESDTWLHGAAALAARPKGDATLALTLQDSAGAVLDTFSGALTADGVVTLTADAKATADVEVLGGEVFAAAKGYELALDLAGADTFDVAVGTLVVTEGKTGTKTAVSWGDVGTVWAAALADEPAGAVQVKVKTYDASGKKSSTEKTTLGVPWVDGADGTNTLATDDDPLTTVGLLARPDLTCSAVGCAHTLAVNSDGWTADSAPTAATVELGGGDTLSLTPNSYQRRATGAWRVAREYSWTANNMVLAGKGVRIELDATELLAGRVDELEPVCDGGLCATLSELEDGDHALTLAAYDTDAAALADELDLTLSLLDAGGKTIHTESDTVAFSDDVSVLFANEVTFTEDPLGQGLTGKVSLLAESGKKGKLKTVAKGKFAATFSRDADGDLTLTGSDKDEVVSAGELVVAGDALTVELTDTDKDGVCKPPPVTPVASLSGGTVHRGSESSCKVGLCCRD